MPLTAAVFAVAAAFCGAANAQAAPLAFSAGVAAQAGAMHSGVLPGNDVTTGTSHLVGGAHGTALYEFSPSWNVAAIDLAWDLSSHAYTQTSTASGGATRHELWLSRPVDGRFVISWAALTTGTGAVSFGFDLFDDGAIDAVTAAVLPVSLPAGLTAFRVHTSASANAGVVQGPWGIQIPYQGTAMGQLTIRFEPTHCSASAYAPSCGGLTAGVTGNFLGGATLTSQCASTDDLAIAMQVHERYVPVSRLAQALVVSMLRVPCPGIGIEAARPARTHHRTGRRETSAATAAAPSSEA